VRRHLNNLSPDAVNWQPEPGRWSIAKHLDHLITTWDRYQPPIQGAIEDGRSRGVQGQGPFRHGWFGNFFIRFLEPPPRMKVKAPGPFQPAPDPMAIDDLRSGFSTTTSEMKLRLQEADGLDLARLRLTSPISSLVRFSLGQSFGVVLTHSRRHLWHADRIVAMPDLPGREG